MNSGIIESSNTIKYGENDIVPRKHLIDKYFWFVNAGILPDSIYEKAVLFIGTYKLNSADFMFILFLGIKYMIHHIELFIFDNTPLLIQCIMKHLRYLQSLLGTQRKSKKYLNYRIIIKLQFIFNNLSSLNTKNYVCRQIYIDQLEKFCNLFATRLNIWLKNPRLQAILFRYGYDPCRSSVIYNSFLIPNMKRYLDPLCQIDQKFIEKIEIKCNCKIMVSPESMDCFLFPEYIMIEVLFDLYRGNYIGFLDMFGYIVKQINPTQYFAKSLRTVLIEGSTLYNILTNVPIRKLKYLEKHVIAGYPVAPFLNSDSISKKLLSIVALIRDQDPDANELQGNEISQSDGSEDVSKELEFKSGNKRFYRLHSTPNELSKLQDEIIDINYSQKLLRYFQSKYDIEIMEINNDKKIEKELLENQHNSKKINDLNSTKKEISNSDTNYITSLEIEPEINTYNIHKPLGEYLIDIKTEKLSNVIDETCDRNKNAKLVECSSSIYTDDAVHYSNAIENSKGVISSISCRSGVDNNKENDTNNMNNSDIMSFNQLQPKDQFRFLINQSFDNYYSEQEWINHKMRLMLRCDTEQTIDDIKYPFIADKRSIKDRLSKQMKFPSNFPKINLSKTLSNSPNVYSNINVNPRKQSWVSKAASRILSGEIKSTDKEDESSSTSEGDILNWEDLKNHYPEVFLFLEKYGKKLVDSFISKRLYRKKDWLLFLGKKLNFEVSKSVVLSQNCDFEYIFKNVCEKNANRLKKLDDPISKKILASLLLISKENITDKEFAELLKGKGIHLSIIDKINKSQSAVPTHIGNLDEFKSNDYLPNLSRCMCQMMYDLIQIAHESSQDAFYILKVHISILDEIIRKIDDKSIKCAFDLLNIRKELSALNFKSYVHGYGTNVSMIYMAEELSFLHDIIFKQPCCSYKISKHLGLHILYHSLQLDDKLNAVEPFLKLPGDRRIKKIEKMCNCIIALRTKKHPTITINEYVVDIFYDYDTGNHFGAMDLLKQMMSSQNRLMTIQDHRTLVAYPSGELWVFRDTEWLKKCYNINENENVMVEIFKKQDEMKEIFQNAE